MAQPGLITIFLYRRDYGRRYSDLPVDQVSSEQLSISCVGTYARPEHYDIRQGDIVRWRSDGQIYEATVAHVRRSADALSAELQGAHALPEDYFLY